MVHGRKHSRSAASFTVSSFSIRTILQFPLPKILANLEY